MYSRTEGAWVICPQRCTSPIQLVRVIEGWMNVDDEDLVDGCVPMDGSIRAFAEVGNQWYEKYGGLFTDYSSVEEFVIDVFRFDPIRGCWHGFAGETDQQLWPIQMDDYSELESMGSYWQEALARILSSIDGKARGRALLRVPLSLRSEFSSWCRSLVDSKEFDEGMVHETQTFRRLVEECANELEARYNAWDD